MKKLFLTIIVLTAVLGLLVAWFYSLWDYADLRYKLTYTVETPTGTRVGQAVVSVRREDTTKLPLPNNGVGHSVTGEAVVVDLGDDKFLFSLIQEDAYALPQDAFKNLRPKGTTIVEFTRFLSEQKPVIQLSVGDLPMLVTFDNINDPTTVKQVNPNDLAASFGAGYSLKSMTLEITDEPVTDDEVEMVLGWLCELKDKRARLNGSTSVAIMDNELSNNLGSGAFKTGDCL